MFVHSVVSYNRSMACNEKISYQQYRVGRARNFLMRPGRNAFYYYPSVISAQCSLVWQCPLSFFQMDLSLSYVVHSIQYLFLILKVMPKKAKSTNLFGMIFFEIADSFEVSIRTLILYFKAFIVKSMQYICKNICKAVPQLSTKPLQVRKSVYIIQNFLGAIGSS